MSDEVLEPLVEERRRSGVSWAGIFLGLILGLALGIFYTREIDPIIVRNVSPADLSQQDKLVFIMSIAQEYAADQDLPRTVGRLLAVEPDGDPYQIAADAACELIRSGQLDSQANIEIAQQLRVIYESQGYTADCDVAVLNTPVPATMVLSTPTMTPTATITPVATKTPTQPFIPESSSTPVPTPITVSGDGTIYRAVRIESFCDSKLGGIIEVYVRDESGASLPGVGVKVSWSNGQKQQVFYTGLKPERGSDYADFEMESGQFYVLEILDGNTESIQALESAVCDSQGTLRSYRVVIQHFDPEE